MPPSERCRPIVGGLRNAVVTSSLPFWHGAASLGLELCFGARLLRMDRTAAIVITVLVLVPIVLVGGLFAWAALKDGQEDKALQKRLGIRRRTRLGR